METSRGSMNLYLIGKPVNHSLSPAIYMKYFEAIGLEIKYKAIEVERDLDRMFNWLRDNSMGFNVTIPFKLAATRLIDELDEHASIIGAVNTVKSHKGHLVGYNTDWIGFTKALLMAGPRGYGSALLIGAGGAGRAAAYALARIVDTLYIVSNTGSTAATLSRLATQWGVSKSKGVKATIDNLMDIARRVDLIVNASPVGLNDPESSPLPARLIPEKCVVLDMVYRPLSTRLLRDAQEKGCTIIDGLWMLVHQAVENIKIWLGLQADPPQLRDYALQAMGDNS